MWTVRSKKNKILKTKLELKAIMTMRAAGVKRGGYVLAGHSQTIAKRAASRSFNCRRFLRRSAIILTPLASAPIR